jgi:Ca2+:H+ antiporter
MNGAMLMITATGLILPATFHLSAPHATRHISLEISVMLFLVYLASLVYKLSTHKPALGVVAARAESEASPRPEGGPNGWSRRKAIAILVLAATGLAVTSEILTDALEPATRDLGLTPMFAGVYLLALAGNLVEMFNAVSFARANKMDLALGLTVGSSIQIALVVAPALVFCGFLLGRPMDLLFHPFEIVAIVVAVLLTRHLTGDGQSNWLEGMMLMAVYLMIGFGFYHLPAEAVAP